MELSKGEYTAIFKVASWDECRILSKTMRRWLFRGQSNSEWTLKSSVERALESRDIPITRHSAFELMVLSEFKAVAHNFCNSIPSEEDIMGWLSLIQHYGGPTRFLDITESFYIASHFALDGAKNECSIWAINRPELIKILPDAINELAFQLGKQYSDLDEKLSAILQASIADDINPNLVLTSAPSKKSERQFTQKGLSLIPLNINNGYMECLLNSFSQKCEFPNEIQFEDIHLEEVPEIVSTSNVIKIEIPKTCFLDARIDLNSMNINAFSLFRGLDGLGKHLSDILNSIELYERLKKDSEL